MPSPQRTLGRAEARGARVLGSAMSRRNGAPVRRVLPGSAIRAADSPPGAARRTATAAAQPAAVSNAGRNRRKHRVHQGWSDANRCGGVPSVAQDTVTAECLLVVAAQASLGLRRRERASPCPQAKKWLTTSRPCQRCMRRSVAATSLPSSACWPTTCSSTPTGATIRPSGQGSST